MLSWCAAAKRTETSFPGYYLHIEPGSSFVAGGAYIPPSPWLKAIGRRFPSGDKLTAIINSKEYKKYFSGLEGEKLKVPPRGYLKG